MISFALLGLIALTSNANIRVEFPDATVTQSSAPQPGKAAAPPSAQPSDMMAVVPTSDSVYKAFDDLVVQKILLGYPRKYFTGIRVLTNYEFAVALRRCAGAITWLDEVDPKTITLGPPKPEIPVAIIDAVLPLTVRFKRHLIGIGYDWDVEQGKLLRARSNSKQTTADKLVSTVPESITLKQSPSAPLPPSDASDMFKDVPASDKVYPIFNDLVDQKVLLGYPINYFAGKRLLTTYEFTVALLRCLQGITWPNDKQEGDRTFDLPKNVSVTNLDRVHALAVHFKRQLAMFGYALDRDQAKLLRVRRSRLQAVVDDWLLNAGSFGLKQNTLPIWSAQAWPQLPPWERNSAMNIESLNRPQIVNAIRKAAAAYVERGRSSFSSRGYTLSEVVSLHRFVLAFKLELFAQGFDVAQFGSSARESERGLIAAGASLPGA